MSAIDTIPALEHAVYVKKAGGAGASGLELDGGPVGDPSADGFAPAWDLRCRSFTCEGGPGVGSALLEHVSASGSRPSFESVIGDYDIDDRVRVIVYPMDHPVLGSDLPAGLEAMTVFEGLIDRVPFELGAASLNDEERVLIQALPNPVYDDVAPSHTIRGRWVADDPAAETPAVAVLETLDLPAVFNFRGRPNCSDATVEAMTSGGPLTGHLFTHDDDEGGLMWTLGKAIAALLVVWGVGVDTTLPRGFDVERLTLDALSAGGSSGGGSGEISGGRWDGLDAELPEVNVHGLGLLEGIDAVCRAAGFEMFVRPHFGLEEGYDRLYVLSVQRKGGGPEAFFKLQPRDRFASADHNETLRRNSITRLRGVRDAGRVRNEALAYGLSYVEAAVPLRPLWRPAEVTADPTAANYLRRHVRGGADFAAYRHVGRVWGLDCTGAWEAAGGGYSDGLYAQAAGGFDWVAELGLNAPGNALLAARAAAGVADPIVWTRRVRPLLPLRRPAARALGLDYVLEVSEDGGGTWSAVSVPGRTLRDGCGFTLDVADLHRVNLAVLAGEALVPAEGESWWERMAAGSPQLAFRLTCCVPADHAAVGFAPRRSSAGSVYARRDLARSEADEVWAVPDNYFTPGAGAIARVDPFGVVAGAASPSVLDRAEVRRAERESLRIAADAYTWQMDFPLWRLGDRVTSLQGRNYRFAVGADGDLAPSIVGIEVTLSGLGTDPERAQGVRLRLSEPNPARRGAA